MKYHYRYMLTLALAAMVAIDSLVAKEIVLYSYEGTMTESDGGFLWLRPNSSGGNHSYIDLDAAFNTDLTEPLDYRGGEMHVYLYIRNQPVPQSMKVCINLHQPNPGGDHVHEIGSKREIVYGAANSEYSWVYEIDTYGGWTGDNFWVAWGRTDLYMDWSSPRSGYTIRLWNLADGEVHAANGKNWSGEDPKKWFPLDITYFVVVVEKGGEFSGWDHYVNEEGRTLTRLVEEEASTYFSGLRAIYSRVNVRSSWFGIMDIEAYPVVVHSELGALYCGGTGGESLWMYSSMEGVGWFWTSPTYYPYIYLLEAGTWACYYKGTSDPAWFYLYQTNEWISRESVGSF